jgi:predicted ATPase
VLVNPWVESESVLSLSLWLQGRPDRAQEHSRRAVSMAEELGHPYSLGAALGAASWLHMFRREREQAAMTVARVRALGVEKGFAGLVALAKIIGAWTLPPAQCEQGLSEIRQGMAELCALYAESNCTDFLTLLAEASARAGQFEEGLKALDEAETFLDLTQEYFWEAEIHRLRGELLLQRDPAAVHDAEPCFHKALSVARRQQARSLELRAALSLARLWSAQEKAAEARELLAAVYGGFTEGFQTHDLQQAKAMLEQASR